MDNDTKKRDQMFLKLYLKSHPGEVTDEEIDYFREHPDQIDEVTAPVNVHKLFLWWGALLGVALVALSNRSLRVNPANVPQSLAQHRFMQAKGVRPHCCRFDIRRRVGLRLGSYQVFPVDVQAFSLPSSPITLNAAAACQS
jgi:hypothetical protein